MAVAFSNFNLPWLCDLEIGTKNPPRVLPTMMKILQILPRHLIAMLIAAACSQFAFAIGDSGGCSSVENSPLGQALISGTAAQAEKQIRISAEKQERDYFSLVRHLLSGAGFSGWKNQRIKEVIAGTKPILCSPGPLLRIAVRAGNIEVVRHLLTHPAGANPNAPIFDKDGKIYSTVFMSCGTTLGLSGIQKERRLQAFRLALETEGSTINFVDSNGRTAISTCFQSDLVELYLSHGADPSIGNANPFDSSIRWTLSASSIFDRNEGLRIVDIYRQTSKNRSITKTTEWEICSVCTEAGSEEFCKELSRRVEGVSSRLFEYSGFVPASRCRELVEQRDDLGPVFHIR